MWVFAILAVLLIGAIMVVATGRGGSMHRVEADRPDSVVPLDRPLTARDLRQVRFAAGLRGYRTDEVDSLLDRLAEELEARELGGTPHTTGTGSAWFEDGQAADLDELGVAPANPIADEVAAQLTDSFIDTDPKRLRSDDIPTGPDRPH
jgi:DivIVA domain-containing protein